MGRGRKGSIQGKGSVISVRTKEWEKLKNTKEVKSFLARGCSQRQGRAKINCGSRKASCLCSWPRWCVYRKDVRRRQRVEWGLAPGPLNPTLREDNGVPRLFKKKKKKSDNHTMVRRYRSRQWATRVGVGGAGSAAGGTGGADVEWDLWETELSASTWTG